MKKNEVYFFKENENGEKSFYKPNKDFFANIKDWLSANMGSMAGSIYGFTKGLKSGNVKKAIGYGAAGAMAGGGLDYLVAPSVANRENNFNDMLRHATQEGVLNVVADVAGIGLKYAGNALAKNLKSDNNILGKITDYLPIVGFAKRWHTGNAESARKLIENSLTKEQMEDLRDFAKSFGGDYT
ncbi:hypothetical protein ACRE1S_04160 [Helicobacter himalayensis]|uniref:hypothetical protein n=1 Tax=Helicobacter himalayensis TaxID=1591088 RepID=UPI003D6FFB2A